MTATLTFNIPEDNESFRVYTDAFKWCAVVRDMDDYLRNGIKHGTLTNVEQVTYEEIRSKLHELMEAHEVNYDV